MQFTTKILPKKNVRNSNIELLRILVKVHMDI